MLVRSDRKMPRGGCGMESNERLRKSQADVTTRRAVPDTSLRASKVISESLVPQNGAVVLHFQRVQPGLTPPILRQHDQVAAYRVEEEAHALRSPRRLVCEVAGYRDRCCEIRDQVSILKPVMSENRARQLA
jgi:hypothetical protein